MQQLAMLVSVIFAMPLPALAAQFGEGYSSRDQGGPADISYRAFTIYLHEEACAQSVRPAELRVSPAPVLLQIGGRLHRHNAERHPSELVIEAYDGNGTFLPAVPIHVDVVDPGATTETWGDWDYLEAVREGEAELVVTSACPTQDALVRTRVTIIVGRGTDRAN